METKKELTHKINQLFQVTCGLLGIIILQYSSQHGLYLLLGLLTGGFLGWLIQPYDEKGELRY